MNRRARALVFSLLPLLLLAGCGAAALQVQARAANAVALGMNDALAVLRATYRAEGDALIAAAPDRATAEARLAETRARWRPVWGVDAHGDPCGQHGAADGPCRDGAWPALVGIDAEWARTLEEQIAGHPLDLPTALRLAQSFRAAYCALRAAAPAGVRLPDVPGLTCGAAPRGATP